jgi:PAS domain S-box-containing protein
MFEITNRKQAEEALRRSEESYRNFVARSSEGIFRQDLDAPVPVELPEEELVRRILHESYLAECNDAIVKMYGLDSVQDFLGRRLIEFVDPNDPLIVELTQQYIRSGFRVVDRESYQTDVQGNSKIFRNSMIGIVEDGKLVRTWGIQRDVTEQVKLEEARTVAETAVRRSAEHFQLLVEQASDGIFLADSEGRYIDVNSAGSNMLGYTREEILQRSIADVIFADEIQRIAPEIARYEGGAVTTSEWRFRRKDGSFFIGEVCGRRLPDGRLQGILRDITERKKAQDALRQSEERFRVALKDSPITVFSQDTDLRYTWIYNPQLHWLQDVIGKTDDEIIGPKKAAALNDLKRRVLTSGVAAREEVAIAQDGMSHVFDITIEPLFDAQTNVVGVTAACMDIARLREMADRLKESRDKLAHTKSYLESEIQAELGFEEIIGQSPALREVLKKARIVAPTDSTVLLLGETGTGKELVARSVHALSSRCDNTFVKLNCAAVPSGLLESELFGHEKGAFTGAVSQKIGRIELADKGTLFLDEIGEMPAELQPKLLRVLQDREFERLGGIRTLHVDVRIISATNRDLQQDVADKKFREDLFYRLNVFPIEMPPLRNRRDDIPMLVQHFVRKHSTRMGKGIDTIPDDAMRVLRSWNWPGNVRELENVIERMVIMSRGSVLSDPPAELSEAEYMAEDNLTEMEREHILRVLRETGGVLSGNDGAASRLGLKRTTLQSMIKRLGIHPQEYQNEATGTFGKP